MDNLVRKAGLSEAIFSKTKTLQKSDKICHTYHSSHSHVIGETSMISYVQLQQVTGKVRSPYKSWKSANSGQIATHPAAQHSIELDQWQKWMRQRRRFLTKK